jgi:YfiH family protein
VSAGERALIELEDEFACELPGGGRVLFTMRAHGNLSTMRGEGHEHGLHARAQLADGLALRWLCASRQVHGTNVQRVRTVAGSGGEPLAIDADGHATALAGIGVSVLTADCLPVALGRRGAVAMLHAGWRGLAAGVLEEGVRALEELGGEGPVVAAVGPGAGPCCYEVGPEVHAAFDERSKIDHHHQRANIDLRAIARRRLSAAGVSQICEVRACTICDERFFSHRREGARAGRQGGMAWLG